MIELTPPAVARVKHLINQEKKPDLALRIGVKGGGCSGFEYIVNLDSQPAQEGDQVFEHEGIKVIVDEKSYDLIKGLQIDYKENIMTGGFHFSNPNATKSCGCGTSFSV